MRYTFVAALAVALGVSGPSAAQTMKCEGLLRVNGIYTEGSGGNFYYTALIGHASNPELRVVADLYFTGFPKDVTLFWPMKTEVVSQHTSIAMGFGRGSNQNITPATVQVAYDRVRYEAPTITIANCRRG